ncbi:MAG: AmmeMemoRadiSam system protein B [Candidatus Woesearchaeota archaeon]|nr:MAG: AmmeMemoRadiSam system protein B [Candidatus Woesearchaeota archaeon]
MIREPAVAGTFYPDSPEELKAEIKKCIKDGPGEELKTRNIHGIISPHAGYSYSGVGAAYAHKALAESGYPETLILLGPAHMIGANSIWLGSDWSTPIGKVEVDRELGREIAQDELFDINPDSHVSEHSLEVQLPFIQYFSQKHKLKLPKIVPILFSSTLNADLAEKFAEIIYSKIKDKDVKIVVSSDFTHYGIGYGYLPFVGLNVKDKIYDLDKKAIEYIEKLDLKGFVEYVNKTEATICGAFPISVVISLAKKLGSKGAKLLKYYTSGDVVSSYSNSVSYAAIEF